MTTSDQARQLRLAHQSRRASEHLLDGIRRALCDAGFMRDDDPYGHADLADVIRQAGEARAEPTDRSDTVRPILDCGKSYVHDAHGWKSADGSVEYGCVGLPPRAPKGPAPCNIDHDCPGQVRQPPRRGCAAWDRHEWHPAHQWHSSTLGRVSCDGAPPFGEPRFGDRIRVSFVATFDKRDSTGRYMLLEPAGTVLPDGATVEVIGRAGGAA